AGRQGAEAVGNLAILSLPGAVLDREALLEIQGHVLEAAGEGSQAVPDREDERVEEGKERAGKLDLTRKDQRDVGSGDPAEELLRTDDGLADPGPMGLDDGLGGGIPPVIELLQVLLQLVLKRGRAFRKLDLHLGDTADLVLGVEAGGASLPHALLDLLHEAARVHRSLVRAPLAPPGVPLP